MAVLANTSHLLSWLLFSPLSCLQCGQIVTSLALKLSGRNLGMGGQGKEVTWLQAKNSVVNRCNYLYTFCPRFLCIEVAFWTCQKSLNVPVWRGRCNMKVRRGEMHQEHSFSWSQGIIPIENYSDFLTFYFEFLPDGIIQVPPFSGQIRSLCANKFPCGKGTDGHCDPKRKQLSFWTSPFVLDACLKFSCLILVLYLGLSDI